MEIAIDLSKQHAIDADPKAIQHINSTGNLDRADSSTKFFFVLEEAEEAILNFLQETMRVL